MNHKQRGGLRWALRGALLAAAALAGSWTAGIGVSHAQPPTSGKIVAHHGVQKGPVDQPKVPTRPLHAPTTMPHLSVLHQAGPPVPSRQPTSGTFAPAATNTTSANSTLAPAALNSAASSTTAPVTVAMNVLVITADGSEADLPAIQQTLDYFGTPYTTYVASKTPGELTPTMLANGSQGNFSAVILTTGDLGYDSPTGWASALSTTEWTNLWTYERSFGVRQVTWYTYPTTDYGFTVPIAGPDATDTTRTPLAASFTSGAAGVFFYANRANALAIKNAYTYQAQPGTPAAGETITPLLADSKGNALAVLKTYADGRANLAFTFDSNPYLVHELVLNYGAINWATQGLFLGARHSYLTPQEDDLFIDDDIWRPTTPCSTPTDQTGATYRITGNDLKAFITWQQSKQATTTGKGLVLTHAFNGYGTTKGAYRNDTLTSTAKSNQDQFFWVNHTYDHENLDATSYAETLSELTQNDQVAGSMGFSNFSVANLVTPDISGLGNKNAMQAAYDSGVRQTVSDTSIASEANPSPNAGLYNALVPGILEIPRRPTNLYYNVSTPQQWVAEYNCIYKSYWGKNLTYQQILDVESQNMLLYLLEGDVDPLMFHQPNLRNYSGGKSLLGDLIDATLVKYNALETLPVRSLKEDELATQVSQRMTYNSAGVTATIVPGQSITITAKQPATFPVTGINTGGAENYGGQSISTITLAAGQSVTLPQTSFAAVTPQGVSATASTVSANPTTVTADGSASATITVTLVTTGGAPAAGKTVTLAQGGHSTITAVSGTTNAAGQASFTVKDATVENVTYTASDTSDGIALAQTATVAFTTESSGGTGATHFSVSAPASATAGSAISVTVTALNASNAAASNYTGTVRFVSSDAAATLPANYSFTAADGGTHTFSVTLKTAGTQSVAAVDTVNSALGSSATVGVAAAGTTKFAVSAPATASPDVTFSVTVKAQDSYGNVVTSYTGKTSFDSSDNSATTPKDYTFTAADAGVHTFPFALETAGNQTVIATQYSTGWTGQAVVKVQ